MVSFYLDKDTVHFQRRMTCIFLAFEVVVPIREPVPPSPIEISLLNFLLARVVGLGCPRLPV